LNIETDRINNTLKSLDDNEKEIILRVLFSEEEILDENKKSILKSIFSNFNEFIQRVLEFEETDTAKILIFLNSRNQSVMN
jgi:predicted thioredoxin/glutaredoxin